MLTDEGHLAKVARLDLALVERVDRVLAGEIFAELTSAIEVRLARRSSRLSDTLSPGLALLITVRLAGGPHASGVLSLAIGSLLVGLVVAGGSSASRVLSLAICSLLSVSSLRVVPHASGVLSLAIGSLLVGLVVAGGPHGEWRS